MNRRFFTIISALTLSLSAASAQVVGSWKTYFSYNKVDQITDAGDFIYAVSDGNLFALDKKHESLQTFTKVQGMNDYGITHIKYNKSLDALLIVYSNCNIDMLKEGVFHNISDLKRKSITDKSVNDITFDGNLAYLSCGFGIVVVNMAKNEIADTYIIGSGASYTNIYATAFANDSIFALSPNGIYMAEKNGKNLANHGNWTLLPPPPSPGRKMVGFDGGVVVLNHGVPCRYVGGKCVGLCEEGDFGGMTVSDGNLACFGPEGYLIFGAGGEVVEKRPLAGVNDMFADGRTRWIALCGETECALTKWEDGEMANSYKPNGPFSSSVAFAKMRDGKIIAGSGGPFEKPLNTPGIVQVYDNGEWTTITNAEVEKPLEGKAQLYDVLDAEFDPADPRRFYVATWRGLFEFYDKKVVNHYFSDNSALESVDKQLLLVDGLVFDKKNNLWMTNMLCKDLIKVKKNDGTWESLHYSDATNKGTSKELLIDSRGMKWVVCPRDKPGILVVDDNKTPFDNRDDRSRWFENFNEYTSTGVKPVSTAIYRCIAEDKNGAVWIGTELGPLVVSNPERIFSDNFCIERIKITREDNPLFADYLLANEQIETIYVDGANRKWIGTASSGVYLLSEDGQETIHHFTTENSPLTSDGILDISVNEKTGEVLIATANGLVSYMSDAIAGSESYSDVHAYPNPMRETYEGDVVIKGLMESSIIKIADVEGNVVHQGFSNGGIYSWDGKLQNGNRVKTGVYLVFMSLADGSEKAVTKIAVIN